MEGKFIVYPRTWVDCIDSSSLGGCGGEGDTDTESGLSMCSSSASSISGSMDDILTGGGSTISLSRGETGRHRSKFSLATYNILTDICIRDGEYLYCPPDLRYMEARHAAIMEEIKTMAPDIICFQEVDIDNYQRRLANGMKSFGYTGVLHERLDDQGLAVFWREKLFELVQQKHCVLHHLAETYLQMSSMTSAERDTVRRAIERPEAVLLVRLRHIQTGSHVAVANVHVTWSQLKYPALQALQMSVAVNELADFSRGGGEAGGHRGGGAWRGGAWKGNRSTTCAQLMCGDFNSPPDSVPYGLMSTGRLDEEAVECLRDSAGSKLNDTREGLCTVRLFDVVPSVFELKTSLKSAYLTTLHSEPSITNCDEAGQDFRSQLCLDYIWFNSDSLDVTGVLETPPDDVILKHYALPSIDFPSDHLPLMAEFVLK